MGWLAEINLNGSTLTALSVEFSITAVQPLHWDTPVTAESTGQDLKIIVDENQLNTVFPSCTPIADDH